MGCVGAVCLVSLMLACDASAPSSGQAPASPDPVVAATLHEAPVTQSAVTSPGTALMAVRLTRLGEVFVGAVRPKPVPWHGALSPYSPPAGLSSGVSGTDDVRPAAPGVGRAPMDEDARLHTLAVVVRAPDRSPMARILLLDAPGHAHGDVVDPWTTGGAVWRLPWYGSETEYEVVRLSPRSAILARWPAR